MELKANLEHVTKEAQSGKWWITLAVDGGEPKDLYPLQAGPLAVTIRKWRPRRSLDANAYYWVLLEKIAAVVSDAKPVIHNVMLRRYGVLKRVAGETLMTFILDTPEAERKVLLDEMRHLKPTGLTKIADDGRVFRAYLELKGSHEMDTKEMSTLIDGVVMDAKDLDIETLPPIEIERMKKAYEEHTAGK